MDGPNSVYASLLRHSIDIPSGGKMWCSYEFIDQYDPILLLYPY